MSTSTLSLYISVIDRDIGIKQKLISMAWFPLFPEYVSMTKFSIPLHDFLHKKKLEF